MADTSLQSPYDPKGALPKSKWKLYQHGTKGTYKIIKVGATIPEGFGQVPNTGAFSKHANVRKKMQDLKSKGSPFNQKFKSPGSGKAGQPTYGDIIKRLGGNLGKFAKYAVKTTGAALALEAGIVALGRGQGLNKEQKAVFKAAGVPRSIWGGESQGVFRDQVASMERAKERQADRDAGKKKRQARATRKGFEGMESAMKPKAASKSVTTRASLVPEAPAKKPGASSPTVAVGNVGKLKRKQEADKRIADNLKEIEEKKARQNIVKSTTRGLPKTATDLPFEAGPRHAKATEKTVTTRANMGGRSSKVSPAPGSVTGEKEAFMRREEKVTPRPETSIERSKRMQPQVAAKLKDAQKRLAPSNTAITRRGPRVEDMQDRGMGAITAAPRPAPPRPGFKPPVPAASRPRTTPMMPRGQDMAGMAPPDKVVSAGPKRKDPYQKTAPIGGKYSQAEVKEAIAKDAAKQKQKAKTRTKALFHGARQADASAGGEFGKLGKENRRPVSRPELTRFGKKPKISAEQKKTISGAVKKQKSTWRDPDKLRKTLDPSLKQKKRDDWTYMEEEQGGRRKGGKITKKKATKKSSTPRRSRPKNPTLQKTSYNY